MTLGEQQKCSRFLKPEKLSDLRTKREIELMNGRSGRVNCHRPRCCRPMVRWKNQWETGLI